MESELQGNLMLWWKRSLKKIEELSQAGTPPQVILFLFVVVRGRDGDGLGGT